MWLNSPRHFFRIWFGADTERSLALIPSFEQTEITHKSLKRKYRALAQVKKENQEIYSSSNNKFSMKLIAGLAAVAAAQQVGSPVNPLMPAMPAMPGMPAMNPLLMSMLFKGKKFHFFGFLPLY